MSSLRVSADPRSPAPFSASRPLALQVVCAMALLATACGADEGKATTLDTVSAVDDAGADAASDSSGSNDSAEADTSALPLDIKAADFDCIKGWTKVRGFYLKSLIGSIDAALAVANNPAGGTYPPGTLIQLVPTEAMVKRESGFSPQTNDWEFFFLKVDAKGTTIVDRGATEVKNGFGGNCFGCHNKADPKWDLVCEQGHGCDPLPFTADMIAVVQANDPRCK